MDTFIFKEVTIFDVQLADISITSDLFHLTLYPDILVNFCTVSMRRGIAETGSLSSNKISLAYKKAYAPESIPQLLFIPALFLIDIATGSKAKKIIGVT